jgi:transcriptional regulator with XRE-family HTH domain
MTEATCSGLNPALWRRYLSSKLSITGRLLHAVLHFDTKKGRFELVLNKILLRNTSLLLYFTREISGKPSFPVLFIFVHLNAAVMTEKKIHEGKNIKRLREILGIKQETLATALNMSQQNISLLEAKETIDPTILQDVAKALNVPMDAIKNFSEDQAMNIISNTFTNNQNPLFCNLISHYNPTFNPIDKVVELYERLLQVEREKNELLQGKK